MSGGAAQRLGDLAGPDLALAEADMAIPVTGLTADSRQVRPGMVFAALQGARSDGARFLDDAIARGAAAVIASTGTTPHTPRSIPILMSDDPRRTLAVMAARFYPRQPATVVAVTGTSGKTSVAEFTRQIFAAAGHPAASLGTIGVVKPSGAAYGGLTTPDPVVLHRTLDELAADGVTHAAMEASSHGLDQRRLDGVRLIAGGFTNLGRDHLDYHPTMEDYFAAKARLFDTLLPLTGTAVIDVDGDWGRRLLDIARARGLALLTTGRTGNDLRLLGVARDGAAQRLDLELLGRRASVRLPLVGEYQASNALVAGGLALAAGLAVDQVLGAWPKLKGVPGRLEIVGDGERGLVVVDYAHKPDALAAALAALRPFASGRLVCVFGCGGDRDRGKRPIMGRIATERADLVIVTDDNPRSEDPAAIRAGILAGVDPRSARPLEIGDRRAAIVAAIEGMRPGDVLVIAGKGHEDGQIVGDTTLPFSDHAVAREALAAKR